MFIGTRHYFTTSTAPQVSAKHTEEGFIIRPQSLVSGGFNIFFSVFAISSLLLFSTVAAKNMPRTPNLLAVAVIGGIIVLIIVLLVGNMLRFGPASITAQSWPLSLDQATRLQFHRRAYFGNVGQVRATLYCTEKTIYHNTKHGKMHQITIWKSPFPVIQTPEDASSANAEWQICIPPDLSPSFETKANAIEWFLDVEVGSGLLGGAHSTFLLHVQPVCASS